MVVSKSIFCVALALAVFPVTVVDAATNQNDAATQTETETSGQPRYVFPFSKVPVRWPRDHLHYPAVDVHGCYARVLAPTSGVITEVRRVDKWDPKVDSPGTRGGLTITMHGDDTVRYYFSHLGRIKVRKGERVEAGHWIGVIGSSGNARVTRCHLHLGMSRICEFKETALQRGEMWPQKYLAAWKRGEQLSPRKEKNEIIEASPNACTNAASDYIEENEVRTKRRRENR